MKVNVAIDGQRSDEAVLVLLSAEDGQLVFTVPTVNRAAACTFSVPVDSLQEAIGHLAPKREHAPGRSRLIPPATAVGLPDSD